MTLTLQPPNLAPLSVIPKVSHKIVNNPLGFIKRCWPHVTLNKEQREIICSVRDNEETFVPAANQMGKDFILALTIIWWEMRTRPARVLATSPQFSQLDDVLWGELRKLIRSSKVPLPLKSTHMLVRQVRNDGSIIEGGECRGQAVSKGEALLGRHLPRVTDDSESAAYYKRMGEIGIPVTLLAVDEGSGMEDEPYDKSETWAHRRIVIGNCYTTTNFFYRGVESPDTLRPSGKGYHKKTIRIRAEQSPNIQFALKEIEEGKEPSNKVIIPGVKDWPTYQRQLKTYDEKQKTIQLWAEFWEGEDLFLFPREALHKVTELPSPSPSGKIAIGVDPAEGGDNTSWTVINSSGVIEVISKRTPDTSKIVHETVSLINKYKVNPADVAFDRGGGGKQHADRLREDGYNVRTVGFGEGVKNENSNLRSKKKSREAQEEKYSYKNRRAQMYGVLSQLIASEEFAISHKILHTQPREDRKSLYDQLRPIPRLEDSEGRLYLPPKNKPNPNSKATTLVELIGHSPDEADSLALAVYCLRYPARKKGGAIV